MKLVMGVIFVYTNIFPINVLYISFLFSNEKGENFPVERKKEGFPSVLNFREIHWPILRISRGFFVIIWTMQRTIQGLFLLKFEEKFYQKVIDRYKKTINNKKIYWQFYNLML